MKKNVVLQITVALLLILSLFAVSCRGNKKNDENNGSDSISVSESVKDAVEGSDSQDDGENSDESSDNNSESSENNEGNEAEDEETTYYDWQFDYTEGEVVEFPEVPVED